MDKECLVCKRMPLKDIARYAHRIFNEKLDKTTIHKIILESAECINELDQNNRIALCGKSQAAILSGLFYILNLKYGYTVSQHEIATAFKGRKNSIDYTEQRPYSIHAVRHSFKFWKELLKIESLV